MFLLKKIVTPFLLPPGIFITGLLVAGVGLLFRKRGRSGAGVLLVAGLMWMAATHPASDWLCRPLVSGFPLPQNPDGDVIVLLCGGSVPNAPDLTGTGRPSHGTLARTVAALRLFRMLDVPIIVSGGDVFGEGVAEALIVRRFLVDMGVPGSRIIAETQSRDTYENALFSAAICRKKGFDRPILVTAAIHLKRAVWCFAKAGLTVLPFPADPGDPVGKPRTWRDFLPIGYRELSGALHEHLGLLAYRLICGG